MKTKPKPTLPGLYYDKYLAYIENTGGSPTVEWFDDDWAPIGAIVRQEMEAAGLIKVVEGRIYKA